MMPLVVVTMRASAMVAMPLTTVPTVIWVVVRVVLRIWNGINDNWLMVHMRMIHVRMLMIRIIIIALVVTH